MKTAIQNYADLIDNIFGAGTASFDKSHDVTNNVIGALNHPEDFRIFKSNFTARLERLNKIYSSHPDFKEIIVQVNEVASEKNWDGAFAELAAFDYFNQGVSICQEYNNPVKLNVTLDKSETFALELGKTAANLDGFAENVSLYFDVKCFKDNVTEILNGIYKQLRQHFNRDDFHISAEHALDISYDDYKRKRNDLFNELKAKIVPSKKTKYVNSSVISNLSFRLLWGAGIQTVERTYNPFSHAENYHKMAFNYANKFVKKKHSVIVLVVFPWYNLVVSDFCNSNIQLYRALSRRVFCQYRHDSTAFSAFNSKFSDTQTIYEVSNTLSGIIFLEDKTILNEEPAMTNVNSYVYLNPNAVNPLTQSLARDYLMGLHNTEFDDFEYDNY